MAEGTATQPPDVDESEEHRATWLELFFDLVVVVAVAQLVHHLLEEPDLRGIGVFVMLYTAIWMSWTSFMLYANIAAEKTRQRAMLLAMAGLAVMAAAIPEVPGEGSTTFAAAYVVVRLIASRSWQRTNAAMIDWPAAQTGMGLVPWIVSIWVDAPVQQYLWVAGLAIDLVASIVMSGRPEAIRDDLTQAAERRRRVEERRQARHPERSRLMTPVPPLIRMATLNVSHFGERLGLFVIIVLGEAVAQLIVSASHSEHTHRAAIAGFVILVGLWWLIFNYGFASAPHARLVSLPPRFALPIHLVLTASIGLLSAGLGAAVEHPDDAMPAGLRWILCGGLATYFLVTTVGAVAARAPLHWVLAWGLPAAVAPCLLAWLGESLDGWVITAGLLAVVGWQAAYNPVRRQLTTWRTSLRARRRAK